MALDSCNPPCDVGPMVSCSSYSVDTHISADDTISTPEKTYTDLSHATPSTSAEYSANVAPSYFDTDYSYNYDIFDGLTDAPLCKKSRLDDSSQPSTSGTSPTPDDEPSEAGDADDNRKDGDEEFYEYYYQMKDCHEDILKKLEEQLALENTQLDQRSKELEERAQKIIDEHEAEAKRKQLIKSERQFIKRAKAQMQYKNSQMARANREKMVYCCFVCSRAFLDEEQVRDHVSSVHLKDKKEHPHKCSQCYMRFKYGHHLRRHEMTHKRSKNNSFQCSVCSSLFKEEKSLEIHMSEAHSLTIGGDKIVKKLKCTECGKKFGLQAELQRHQWYCLNKSSIQLKRKVAKETLRIGSPVVSPAMSTSSATSTLSSGSALNKSVKDKSCPFCFQVMASMQSRDRHIGRAHPDMVGTEMANHTYVKVDSPDLPYMCNDCGKRFATNASLGTHKKRIHEKILDHACDTCGKKYPLASELRKHINRAHRGGFDNVDLEEF